MKNGSPKYKFDKFDENWLLVKISNIACQFKTGGTPNTKVPIFWDGTIPWIQSSDLQKDKLFGVKPQKFISEEGLQNSSAKLIPKNSIAIVTRVGVGKLAIIDQEYATSQDFLSLSDFNGDTQFIVYSIYRMLQKESTQLQGTSIKGITKEDLLSKKINFPEIEEQQVIGSLFRTLDDLMASYKDNIANYQSLKTIMLSKMFPKAGQTVPEIRLDGLVGEWERNSLSEVCTINSGRDYKHLKYGDIPVYGTGGYMLSVNEKLCDEDAIGIGRKGTIDKPYLLLAPFWTVDTLFYVTCKVGYDLNYLFLIFQKVRWKKFDESTGVPSLSKKTIEKVVSKFPSFSEQQAIGTYFSNLDNLINYYREKISQLETLKKKLLQDMFI